MYKFEEINLTINEKLCLFSFYFKRKQKEEQIKYFHQLYYEYDFLEANLTDTKDSFGSFISDGTYSTNDRYIRFKIYRRRIRFQSLPNWVAIMISLISLALNVLWHYSS